MPTKATTERRTLQLILPCRLAVVLYDGFQPVATGADAAIQASTSKRIVTAATAGAAEDAVPGGW